jgi:hypothetical protein
VIETVPPEIALVPTGMISLRESPRLAAVTTLAEALTLEYGHLGLADRRLDSLADVWLFLPATKFFASPNDYLPMHTLLELLSIVVSCMVFGLAWSLRWQANNSHRMLLGAGLLAVALIDVAHMLSYPGMPDFVTPSSPEKAINFWLAARFISPLLVLLLVALRPPATGRHSVVAASSSVPSAVGLCLVD